MWKAEVEGLFLLLGHGHGDCRWLLSPWNRAQAATGIATGAEISERREIKYWAGGRDGMGARDCHLHLREEGDGENGATERCQGDFGEGQNVLQQLDWRRVGAGEGKGMEKDEERGGEPLWPSCP